MYPASPSDPTPLTGEEHAVLAAIATHEHRRDSRFADALSVGALPAPGSGARRGLLALVVVLAVVGTFVLSTVWLVALVAALVLVVIPTVLVVWALRQGRVHPD